MASPSAAEARLFYRSAKQRFIDSRFLLQGDRTTAAMYLAGYSVECMLKALILALSPAGSRKAILASFRGGKAHDFIWLKDLYHKQGGADFPPEVVKAFARVNTWTTAMRYNPATAKKKDAALFLGAAETILNWADGRL
jgi:HEPN domain-containing protein